MSRVKSTRPPFATMSMFSAIFAPKKSIVSKPSSPSIDVVAIARIPLEHVVAGAHLRQVVAVVAEQEVVALTADQLVIALAAEDRVVAGAAVEGELDHPGRQCRGRDPVVAAEPLDDEGVVRAFGPAQVHLGREAHDRHRSPGAENVDDVVAVGRADIHGVGRGVACRAADRRAEIDVDLS